MERVIARGNGKVVTQDTVNGCSVQRTYTDKGWEESQNPAPTHEVQTNSPAGSKKGKKAEKTDSE